MVWFFKKIPSLVRFTDLGRKAVMKPRAVYLGGEIDEKSISKTVAKLLDLDQRSRQPIRLFVTTEGGFWRQSRHLCETILHRLASPVITIGVGEVSSAGVSIVCSGALRLAFPRTEFLLHGAYTELDQTDIGASWSAEDHLEEAKDLKKINQEDLRYCTRRQSSHLVKCKLSARTLKSRIAKAKEGEYILFAEEAKRLGLIDATITNVDSIGRYEEMLKGGQK